MSQVDKDGPQRQRLAIEAYANAHGYEIAQWFNEEGVSGRTSWEDRKEWCSMLAALNGCRTIIVENLSRLARELMIQEMIMADLQKRDIKLLSAAGEETDNGDPTRVMLRQILGSFHQYERTVIVLKLRGARNRKKAATGRCEGQLPYGSYPSEETRVDVMLNFRIRGLSPTEIAREMNSLGMFSRSGKPWKAWTINRILKGRVK